MQKQNYEIYDTFDDGFWYVHTRRDLLNKLLKTHINKIDNEILDLGCGTGFNYKTLNKYGKVTNLDYHIEPLRTCKRKGIPNIIKGDAQNLRFTNNSFDIVTAIELLEHLDDDEKAIKEIHRVLKNHGVFIFTVPAHKQLWSSDDILAEHKRRYSKKELKYKLNKYFKIRYISQRYFLLFIPTVMVFIFQKFKLKKTKEKINSLTLTPKILNNILKNIMSIENFIISKSIRLPIGIGWVGVAMKTPDNSDTKEENEITK